MCLIDKTLSIQLKYIINIEIDLIAGGRISTNNKLKLSASHVKNNDEIKEIIYEI